MSCKCQSCGKKYKVDLVIPDKIWNKIRPKGKPKGVGMLCGVCIMERIEEMFNYDHWNLIKVSRKQWQEYNKKFKGLDI